MLVVTTPPLIRRRLRPPRRGILPFFLTAEKESDQEMSARCPAPRHRGPMYPAAPLRCGPRRELSNGRHQMLVRRARPHDIRGRGVGVSALRILAVEAGIRTNDHYVRASLDPVFARRG